MVRAWPRVAYCLGLLVAVGAINATRLAAASPTERYSNLAVLAPPMAWDEQLEQHASRLKRLEGESHRLTALTIARGRAYVRLARAGLLPASAGFDAFANHMGQLERLRRDISRDLQRQDAIVHERRTTAQAMRALQALQPRQKLAMRKAKDAIVASQEREAAFERAFGTATQKSAADTVYGAFPRGLPAPVSQTLRERLGALPFPISGRTEMTARKGSTGTGLRLSIRGPASAPVRAVHRGRIAFADEYPGLGYTIMLDHGEQLHSVYGNLQTAQRTVGEEVQEGETVGRIGFLDGRPELTFELRFQGQTLNTPEWLGLKN